MWITRCITNIIQKIPNSAVLILAIAIEGIVSQISHLGPIVLDLHALENHVHNFFQIFPIFGYDEKKKSETQFPPYRPRE